jgi:hypothetical protein
MHRTAYGISTGEAPGVRTRTEVIEALQEANKEAAEENDIILRA